MQNAQMAVAATATAKQTPVTAASLAVFFKAAADAGELSRIKRLAAELKASGVADVKEACKGLRDGLKKGDAGYTTAANRASEIRTLYGATMFAGMELVNLGYHASIAAAREALKAKGIKWDGTKIPSADEKARAAERSAQVAAYEAALAERDDRANRGEDVSQLDVMALAEKHGDALVKSKAEKFAASIIKKYGEDFGIALRKALETATGTAAGTVQ